MSDLDVQKQSSDSAVIRFWQRIPVVIRAIVLELLVGVIGVYVWPLIAALIPSLWSIVVIDLLPLELNDGSCVRLRPEPKNHVWSYDFMVARTVEGRAFRILTIIDEYTRECLAILTQRRITSQDIIEQLFYLFVFRRTLEYIRSDNGPEFTAKEVRRWLNDLEVTTLFIERESSWEQVAGS